MFSESSGKVINFRTVKTTIWQTPRSLRGHFLCADAARRRAQSFRPARTPPARVSVTTLPHVLARFPLRAIYFTYVTSFVCIRIVKIRITNRGLNAELNINRTVIFRRFASDRTLPLREFTCKVRWSRILCSDSWSGCIHYAQSLPSCDNDQDV